MNLYKYVAPGRWSDIFKDGLIRFSQPSVFNDPFEMQPYFGRVEDESVMIKKIADFLGSDSMKACFDGALRVAYMGLPADSKGGMTFEQFRGLAEEGLQRDESEILSALGQRIALLANSNGQFTGEARNEVLFINKLIGILSLTEKRDNLLMWAHYAQYHQGLVIEFDETHEYFNQELEMPPLRFIYGPFSADRCSSEQWDAIEAGAKSIASLAPRSESPEEESGESYLGRPLKVVYSSKRPERESLAKVTTVDMLLTKSKDWEYEQEWRVLRFLYQPNKTIPHSEGDIHLFAFPPACVKGVIFGCRMPVALKKEMTEFLASDGRYSHVRRYQAVQNERRFELDIVPSEM